MKTKILLCFFFLLISFIINAQPQIIDISGAFFNGETITIKGLDFGSQGPNIIVFDDFEKGENNKTILLGEGSAAYGNWTASGNPETTYYTSSTSVSGNLSFQANAEIYYSWIRASLPIHTTDVFVAWWLYLPSEDNYPGYNSDRINWKQMWIQGESTTDDDLVVPTALGSEPNQLQNWLICGNEQDPGYINYVTGTMDFRKGEWKRVWIWLDGDSEHGNIEFYAMSELSGMRSVKEYGIPTLKSDGYFERVHVNGYASSAPNCHPTFDDVYIACGTSARARVEIGNKPIYDSCTNLTFAIPQNWTDILISAEFCEGSFNQGETAYVYVFDANGNHNLEGYPISIAGTETHLNLVDTDRSEFIVVSPIPAKDYIEFNCKNTEVISLEIEVYDVSGRIIYKIEKKNFSEPIRWNCTEIPSGIYPYKAQIKCMNDKTILEDGKIVLIN